MDAKKICFDGWALDPQSGDLERAGVRSRLQEQPLQLLLELIGSPAPDGTAEALTVLCHALDATGIHALEQFSDRLHKAGKTLLLCGARDQPSRLISRSAFLDHIGPENVLPHVQAALARAQELQGDFEGVGRELAADMARHPL